jgi:uncharacterized protein YcfL
MALRRVLTAAFLACSLLAAGCASNASNSVGVTPGGTAEIRVQNGGLQSECEIKDGGAALFEDKLLAAWVLLKSHRDHKQTLECRWTWEDRDGFEIKANRAWKSVFVNALEEHKVEGRAPAPEAIRGTFELRYHSGTSEDD